MSDILRIQHAHKQFDEIAALDDFSCSIPDKSIVGLIGPNGAGKTTLFNVISGFLSMDSGDIIFNNKIISNQTPHNITALGISRTFQDLRLIRQLTVLDNVLLSFQNQPGERISDIFFRHKKALKGELENYDKAQDLLKYADLAEKANDLANDLSYGQQKLLSIVCCLASDAKLLLLDEPVAGINPEMIEKILKIILELKENAKSILIIEHNMDAIFQTCDKVIFMDTGKKISEGTPEKVKNDSRVIEAYLD